MSCKLLSNFTIFIPMHIAGDAPLPSRMSDALSPDIKRNPEQQNGGCDARHGTVCIDVSRFLDPRIGVK